MRSDFGLTVNNFKTKHMVFGRLVEDGDREPIAVDGGVICSFEEFPFFGSMITNFGRMDTDVKRRIAHGSKAFKALRKAIFLDKDFTLTTKKKIYLACVLSVFMYGTECWNPLWKHLKKVNTFNHICIWIVMGISNQQKWSDRITMVEIRRR